MNVIFWHRKMSDPAPFVREMTGNANLTVQLRGMPQVTVDRNHTVQMFWHGPALSRMERLAIASFLHHGHPVDLYVYEEPAGVPRGACLREAAGILPRESLFTHKRTGSVAIFADWFRYRLLAERGGIWADMDVACLRPIEYPQPEIFGWEDERQVNNAILALPPGHPLARWLADCCEQPNRILPYDNWRVRLRKLRRRHLQGDRRDRVRWGELGPKGLTAAARHLGFLDRALPRMHFYPVRSENWRVLFEPMRGGLLPWGDESRAVHLWNNMTVQSAQFNKNAHFAVDSPFERLCERYGVQRGLNSATSRIL